MSSPKFSVAKSDNKQSKRQFYFSVKSKRALFADPCMNTTGSRFSYEIPTYEAIKGMLQSIYRSPTFVWVVDEVVVMNKIRHDPRYKSIRRLNEKDHQRVLYTYLHDVHYLVKAHTVPNRQNSHLKDFNNVNKEKDMIDRYSVRGGKLIPYLGKRSAGICSIKNLFVDIEHRPKNSILKENPEITTPEKYYEYLAEKSYYKGTYKKMGTMYLGREYPNEYNTNGKLKLYNWKAIMVDGRIVYDWDKAICYKTKRFKCSPVKEKLKKGTNHE